MTNHKLSLESMLDGAPVTLPYELRMTIKPGFGPYATCEGEGSGVTLTVERAGSSRSEHYPNRYQAWQRAQALMGRVAS